MYGEQLGAIEMPAHGLGGFSRSFERVHVFLKAVISFACLVSWLHTLDVLFTIQKVFVTSWSDAGIPCGLRHDRANIIINVNS